MQSLIKIYLSQSHVMTHRVSLLTVAATVRDAPTACLLQGCECEMRLLISVVNWSGRPLLIYLGCVFDFPKFPDTGKCKTLENRNVKFEP